MSEKRQMSGTLKRSLSVTEPKLRIRMLPLALLVTFVIGGLTPWLYQESKKLSSHREAKYMAMTMAEGFQRLYARFPLLWSYKPQEVRSVIKPFEELGSVIIYHNEKGRLIYKSERGELLSSQLTTVSVDVTTANHIPLGLITVELKVPQTSVHLSPWIICGLTALFVGWLLLTVPLRSARYADQQNDELLQELLNLNKMLEQRVSERTLALEQINQRLLTIQEEERARISRNLHDELGQTLTGLRLQLTTLSLSAISDQQKKVIQRSIDVVDLGVDQVRRIAYEQRPPELDMLGLLEAVKAMSSRVSSQGEIQIGVESPLVLPSLLDEVNIALFRACQEGITNAIRHGHCSVIDIIFKTQETSLLLLIADNGIGSSSTIESRGGLSGIYGRLKQHQGSLDIKDSSLGGLLLMIKVPLHKVDVLMS